MKESWKFIPHTHKKYTISNTGRVMRYDGKEIKVNHSVNYHSCFITVDNRNQQINLKPILDDLFDVHIYSVSTTSIEDEIWKPVPGFDQYRVSSYGRIKRIAGYRQGKNGHVCNVQERIRVPGVDEYGYPIITLYQDGIDKTFAIHRLVATVYIPNPDNLPQVNHKDSNKQNNRYSNLEWCTNKENIRHSIIYGNRDPHAIGMKAVESTGTHCKCIETGYLYKSISELSRCLNVKYDTLYSILHRGDIFKFNDYHHVIVDK